LRPANDVFRFLLEMAMLVGLAFAGFSLADGALGWVLGLGLPLLAATLWGMFMAPRSDRRVADPAQLAIEVLLFGGAAALLLAAGEAAFGVALGALAAIHLALTFALEQRVASRA
jgi:Protein of unknown function (DUF2568)